MFTIITITIIIIIIIIFGILAGDDGVGGDALPLRVAGQAAARLRWVKMLID